MSTTLLRARPLRTWCMIGLLVGMVLAAGALGYWLRLPKATPVPVISYAAADRAVQAAIDGARADVVQAPRSASAWGRLGMVLLAHEYRAEARFCFLEAARLDTREGRWAYYLGYMDLRGDTEFAAEQFRKALGLSSETWLIRLRLGQALVSSGIYEEADQQFRAVLEQRPHHPVAALERSRIAFQRNEVARCLEYLQDALASPFTQKAAHNQAAIAYRRLKDEPAAQAAQRRAQQLPGDDFLGYDTYVEEFERLKVGLGASLERVYRLLAQDRLADALTLAERTAADYPNSADARIVVGQTRTQLRDVPNAIREFREALRLDPKKSDAHYYLGVLLFRMEDFKRAATAFREASVCDPTHALACFFLAESLRGLGDRPGAKESYERALTRNPGLGQAHVRLGDLLREEGNTEEAVKHWKVALSLDATDQTTRGKLDQALKSPSGTRP